MSKPETMMIDDRFDSYIEPIPESGCHIWTGANTTRYGTFWDGKKYQSAHRFAYEREYGDIPAGLLVLHKCDVTLCVNPMHLFIGTARDNTNDAISKGRFNKTIRARGEKSGRAVLSEAEVLYIRSSGLKVSELAKILGRPYPTISSAKNAKSWKHITTKEDLNNERN